MFQFLRGAQEGENTHVYRLAVVHDPESTPDNQYERDDSRLFFKTVKESGKYLPCLGTFVYLVERIVHDNRAFYTVYINGFPRVFTPGDASMSG